MNGKEGQRRLGEFFNPPLSKKTLFAVLRISLPVTQANSGIKSRFEWLLLVGDEC